MNDLKITSPAFEAGARIPALYTCTGNNISPPINISGVPAEVESLVLIMDDPDVPIQVREDMMFDHWVVFNIPPETKKIEEGDKVGTMGSNTRGEAQYTGPCPPTEYEPTTHRYFFKLYALDTILSLKEGVTKKQVEEAMEGHIVEQTAIMGTYDKTSS